MYYAIISEDVSDSLAKRLSVREKHLARLRELADQDRLLIAAAQHWADADPYVSAGVYLKVTVKPFKKVF